MTWYYVRDGQQTGPVGDADIQQLVSSGVITAATMVWREGMAGWAAYGTLGQPGAAGPAAETAGNAACRVCRREQPVSEMVPYENTYVCSTCKTEFFQRLQEGVSICDGNTPNGELMGKAREVLRGRWGTAIGVCVVMWLISAALQFVPAFGGILALLVTGSLSLGLSMFMLALARRQDVRVGMLFDGFRRFGTALGAYFLMQLFIVLWMLLLIVPGILAALSYSMTFFILADNPDIGPLEAIRRSKKMMKGRRWKYFCLGLRFVGWSLLAVLTLFIGYLWVMPYYSTSMALFYEDVKERASA